MSIFFDLFSICEKYYTLSILDRPLGHSHGKQQQQHNLPIQKRNGDNDTGITHELLTAMTAVRSFWGLDALPVIVCFCEVSLFFLHIVCTEKTNYHKPKPTVSQLSDVATIIGQPIWGVVQFLFSKASICRGFTTPYNANRLYGDSETVTAEPFSFYTSIPFNERSVGCAF